MSKVFLGLVVVLGLVVTPVVGVACGLIAQSRYKKRLAMLPEKVVAQMPKRFPMADLLLSLFMLGPILGNITLATAPPVWFFSPSPLQIASWITVFSVLIAVNASGPVLIRMGMPPDGSFTLGENPQEIHFLAKPAVSHPVLFDAREI